MALTSGNSLNPKGIGRETTYETFGLEVIPRLARDGNEPLAGREPSAGNSLNPKGIGRDAEHGKKP